MSSRDAELARVIEYWRTVEIFSPQDVPKDDPRNWVYDITKDQPLPWDKGQPEARKTKLAKGKVWQYTVYFGIYNLEETFEALKKACGSDPDSYNERQYDDAALAGMVLNAKGQPQLATFTLSSCAWGLGRALNGASRGWLDGFDNSRLAAKHSLEQVLFHPRPKPSEAVLKALTTYVLGLTGAEELETIIDKVSELWQVKDKQDTGQQFDSRELPTLTTGHLTEIVAMLLRLTGTSQIFPDLRVRVHCEEVDERPKNDDNSFDFLNSMFIEDLAHMRDQVAKGQCPPALRTYLTEKPDTSQRIDVRENPVAVTERVRPHNIPAGRWPANPQHTLALHQQLAVNNAMIDLSDSQGILGVNGPPGTGKTTLLRDVMAALITKRAQALANLKDPAKGFVDKLVWKKGDYDRHVPVLAPELTGYEMVVASSNNGAVENVTKETPDIEAIHSRWRDSIDYFNELGTAVLNSDKLTKPREWRPAWGLAAAKLGKGKYRSDFVNAFWFSDKSDDSAEARVGLQQLLKSSPAPSMSWTQAVKKFRDAQQRVTRLQEDREQARHAWHNRHRVSQELATAQGDLAHAETEQQRWREKLAAQQQDLRDGHDRYQHREADRDAHRARRPGLLEVLFSLGKAMQAWRAEDAELARRAREVREILDDRQRLADDTTVRLRRWVQAATDAAQLINARQSELSTMDETLRRAREVTNTVFPAEPGDRANERATPWTDEELNTARSELFVAALHLHRVFIEHNASDMRKALNSAVDAVKGTMPHDVQPQVRLAAWQALFLVVPVVSTTFASYSRMFQQLPMGALGWLLIDEAGQATPQAAVGAIGRSKRVLSVGDPLQLEPVVTMPFPVQQSLRVHARVSQRWLPERRSVQRLADDATAMGTTLGKPARSQKAEDDDGALWVGTPLTVHRRCDEPMVSICNAVAYDNMMLPDTTGRAGFEVAGEPMRPSKWEDIKSAEAQGHWIPAEGENLDRKLNWLRAVGYPMSEVIMISPFRDVARQLAKRAWKFRTQAGGTVHKAQGKEADIVILVLGGNPSSTGALRWAAEKPNLLNVAVSRAKRRLYVIGDREKWEQLPHFNVLARELGKSAESET